MCMDYFNFFRLAERYGKDVADDMSSLLGLPRDCREAYLERYVADQNRLNQDGEPRK